MFSCKGDTSCERKYRLLCPQAQLLFTAVSYRACYEIPTPGLS